MNNKKPTHAYPGGRVQLTALATLIGLIAWAGFTRIDEAVSASGVVVTDSRMQVVQSPDGGIIAQLLVAEGHTVHKGELIAVLEKERVNAATEDLKAQLAALTLAARRAKAEADGKRPEPDELSNQYPAIWQAQIKLFEEHQRTVANDIKAFDKAIELAAAEQRIMERLQASGDISPTEVMRSERGLLELQQRRESLIGNARTEARREAARFEADMASLTQRIREREDMLQRTDIVAPVDGTVQTIRLKTPGAVLRPGDELLQIVSEQPLKTVELKINPSDIGRLHEGLKASVKLDAWDYTVYGSLHGTVTSISPDTVTEQVYPQPQTYYRVLLSVDNNPANPRLDVSQLKAGMRASADVQTGQRSLLWYLTSPITRAFGGAFKER